MATEGAITKCLRCGFENDPDAERCANPSCARTDWNYGISRQSKSETDYLRSINQSLTTIKRIAIWFLVISILGLLLGFMAATGAFR